MAEKRTNLQNQMKMSRTVTEKNLIASQVSLFASSELKIILEL